MKQDNIEKWVDGVLDSASDIRHAPVPHGLFEKIKTATMLPLKKGSVIPLYKVSIAAASIALLVFANLYMVVNTKTIDTVSTTQKSGIETVVEYYGLQEQDLNYGI